MLSKVCITPAKARVVSISGAAEQVLLRDAAVLDAEVRGVGGADAELVLEALEDEPGVSRGTTNDLIAARPLLGSSVAQTTIRSAREPEVTKIFSPFSTYSSPSRTAVVRIAAESDPAAGSVIAIAAHMPSKRSLCSAFATDAIAELPRPWRGIESSRPTSP